MFQPSFSWVAEFSRLRECNFVECSMGESDSSTWASLLVHMMLPGSTYAVYV